MKKIILAIDGMTCSACSNGLEKYLKKQKGIISASVNLVMENAFIEYDESILGQQQLEQFVTQAGFKSLGIYKENIEEKTDERAKKGIFMSFQSPEEVPGISVTNFLKAAKTAKTGEPVKIFSFKKELEGNMQKLDMNPSYSTRDLNVGFSGGEKKKDEILQMLTLQPKLAILDETDSGLDVDAIRTVSKGINMYKNDDNAVLIITHGTKILQNLHVDYVHVLVGGKIVTTSTGDLAEQIEEEGYAKYLN